MLLNLQKPIVFFDLETTGVNVGTDHIVEICLYKVNPDQSTQLLVHRVRPVDNSGKTLHIPEFTTAIHGISDSDVADKPAFRDLASEIAAFIGDADLAGYNSNKFDVPLLVEEFLRAGQPFDLKCRRLVDVQNIFHKMEQRTLKAAYQFYCGKNLENAHSADADTIATYEVLKSQLDMYDDLKNDVDALSAVGGRPRVVDYAGRLFYNDAQEAVISFGKHKGKTAREVYLNEPSYFSWIMNGEFTLDTKRQFALLKEQFDKERRAGAAAKRKPLNDNEVADAAKLLSEKWTGKLF